MVKTLTKEEITKLSEEYAELGRWKQVKVWAEKYYGPVAVKVEVRIERPWNDGDPVYPVVDSVEVRGADGKYLEPDTSLPAFSENPDFTGNAWARMNPEDFVEKDDLPITEESMTYDLTKEPEISYPRVVVLEENEVTGKLNHAAFRYSASLGFEY